MNRFNRLLYLLLFITITACDDDDIGTKRDEDGVITSKPYHRLAKVTDDKSLRAVLGIANHASYGRGVVLSGKNNGKITLKMIDIDTGKELWEWRDLLKGEEFDFRHYYTYENYFVFVEAGSLYCIDLMTGNTVWKERYATDDAPVFREVNGLGKDLFILSRDPYRSTESNPKNALIHSATIENGSNLKEVVRLPLGEFQNIDHASVFNGNLVAIPDSKGDTLIFCDNEYYKGYDYGGGDAYVSLYNLTQRRWVYDTILLENNHSYSLDKPKYHNGIVYLAMSPTMVAVELMTGKVLWKWSQSQASFATSGFILVPEKNYIVFNAEGNSTSIYALDMTTGTQRWSEPSSGTSSRLQYMNGVVYWVGGGDGLLHAVNVDTGETLWKIRSPDEATNSDAYFTRNCSAFPGENGEPGKIVVSSGLHAFAYEEAVVE